ncbi:hypothetical protein RRG08_016365 [Elysia crispata]|uniref:Uncharacterized protein n=1 Tax=Elysia crispata TaxID=231223 RepID=A0AAE1AEJ4_9GAST|nr:hypothetical protein RRG08_016365 [Elysia crispata]
MPHLALSDSVNSYRKGSGGHMDGVALVGDPKDYVVASFWGKCGHSDDVITFGALLSLVAFFTSGWVTELENSHSTNGV